MTPIDKHPAPPSPELSYTPAIGGLIDLALEEDLGRGDVTTALLRIPGDGRGRIVCRERVVVCGLPVAAWVAERSRAGLALEATAHEGEILEPGGELGRIAGSLEAILRLERTLLKIISNSEGENSGAVYEKLKAETGTGVKKYNQLTAKLEHIGLVESVPLPGRGQTRELRLKHSPADIASAL